MTRRTQSRFVHELFEEQAARTPEATALVHGACTLTYAELNARANQLAHYLRARAIGPDMRVTLCLERGADLMISLLATLKAGGAYVPLDPSYPSERLAYMVEDSASRLTLTQSELAARLPATGGRVLALDRLREEIAQLPQTNPASCGLAARHLAYVIYTSGSTGAPKGVMVEHAGLSKYLQWALETYRPEEGIGAPVISSIAFDATITGIYLPLLCGRAVVLVKEGEELEGLEALCTPAQEPWSLVKISPAHLSLLGERLRGKGASCPVNAFVIGGEALLPGTVQVWQSISPAIRLINEYGPTEPVVGCSIYEVPRDWNAAQSVPIGRPIAGARMYILDDRGQAAPIGVTGEIFIGGAGVARGYLNRPGLTADRFVPDPFARAGRRMYRTGDLARWLPDGNIEYLGRRDHQVKIRGYRVELGEIEAQLSRHAAVKDAVVVMREAAPGDKRLVAYLTHRDEAPHVESLRRHLRTALPDYMIPGAFVMLPSLPLTPNGKVDRKALPAPQDLQQVMRAYEPPRGELEQALAGIWHELLRVERIGRHDNFFDIGGYSLLALRLTARIQRAFGRQLALNDVFASATIAALATRLQAAQGAALPPIEPTDRRLPLPASYAQQRLWLIEHLQNAGAAYHIPLAIRMQGRLDRDALQAALDRIVERHEVLRTCFSQSAGAVVQVVTPPQGFALQRVDLSAIEEAQRSLRVATNAAEEAGERFDLATGPLIRGRLLRVAPEDHVLLLTLHHIVSDGWSLGVLLRELAVLYAAFSKGEPDPLPPLPVQYADYAAWQRHWLQGEALRGQIEYWRNHLAGAPALLQLPTDHPRPQVQSHRGDCVFFSLERDLVEQLRSLARQHDATLFMTIHVALSILLSRLSGQNDIVIGTPLANRNRHEVEGLIGLFLNTLALRCQLDGDPTVTELLAQARKVALDSYSNYDVPFEQVVDAVQPRRSFSHSPIFQVMLIMQNAPQGELTLPGLTLRPQESSYEVEKYDLTLSLLDEGERVVAGIGFASDLFERTTIERWIGYFKDILTQMARAPQRHVGDIELLRGTERARLVTEYNATQVETVAKPIHQLIEAQVARAPHALAVKCADRELSYARLNRKANRLAHYLREQGVGPDERVAICMDRSLEMMVAVLAVLKAGGAYVPVDPGYPPERIAYMLELCTPRVILTRGHLKSRLPSAIKSLALDQEWDAVEAFPDVNPSLEGTGFTLDHLAYVIFTSGSTGQPKGACLPHRGLTNMYQWYAKHCEFAATDRALIVTSFSFDLTQKDLFVPLMVGAQVHLAPEPFDPRVIAKQVETQRITSINITPSAFSTMVEALDAGDLSSLRHVVFGGEAPNALRTAPFSKAYPHVGVVNTYGPTEFTDIVSYQWLPGAAELASGVSIPIGKPLWNSRLYVVDRRFRPVPIGVTGEICLGGIGVARGYLGRPRITAERFVPNPFAATPGERLYLSGDVGRFRADETIEFVARNDHQVKIRGFRIEPGEIAAQLLRHPLVKEALVLARDDFSGGKCLVAYVVPRHEAADAAGPDVEALRAHLAAALPEYMMPSAFVMLESFPLTPNGKLNRHALPAPDMNAFGARRYEPPQGEVEETLARVWAELLGVGRVGRDDNFFALGGHSLLAIVAVERLRAAGLQTDVRTLFMGTNLREVAAAIAGQTAVIEAPQDSSGLEPSYEVEEGAL